MIIVPDPYESIKVNFNVDWKLYKYATGAIIPEGSIYVTTIKNGTMHEQTGYEYVWHYFLVPTKKAE